jgi:copper chaperone CopZ
MYSNFTRVMLPCHNNLKACLVCEVRVYQSAMSTVCLEKAGSYVMAISDDYPLGRPLPVSPNFQVLAGVCQRCASHIKAYVKSVTGPQVCVSKDVVESLIELPAPLVDMVFGYLTSFDSTE